jgi:hypothetical protein
MKRTFRDPDDLIAQYEAMRREATTPAPGVGPTHGLAVFLARGMAAWLEALSALGPPPRPATGAVGVASSGHVAFGPVVRAELTAVLAAMVLACTAAEEVGDESRGEGHGRPFAPGGVPLRPPVIAPASA